MSPQLPPTFAARLAQADRPLAGQWVCSGSAVAAEIVAGSGTDWVIIDMEHSPNGLESVLAQLHAIAGYPTTAVVRVPVGDAVIIKQVLDLGAQNLVVPMVSTPQQAAEVVAAMHYPPRGIRGVGSALARSARWNRVPGYLGQASETVSLIVQIETTEGVSNAAAIAAIDGVDGVLVGPADLAASMSHLGDSAHPDVVAAVTQVFEAVRAAGKPVGVNAFDPDEARMYADAGAAFVLVGADVLLLAEASAKLARTWT